jgi:hypothetical protein
MATEAPFTNPSDVELARTGDAERDEVAERLQQVYEYVLADRRPEAVGATESLAAALDVDIERPGQFPPRANR